MICKCHNTVSKPCYYLTIRALNLEHSTYKEGYIKLLIRSICNSWAPSTLYTLKKFENRGPFQSVNATYVFRPLYSEESWKRNKQRSFRIGVWGKLWQENQVVILMPSFSKSYIFKIVSLQTKTQSRPAFSNSSGLENIFEKLRFWISVDGRPNSSNKAGIFKFLLRRVLLQQWWSHKEKPNKLTFENLTASKCDRPDHRLVPFWKLQTKGICLFALKFRQLLIWHINNKNVPSKFLFTNTFSPRVIFLRSVHIF